MFGCVTVTGPPDLICSVNLGITDPLLPGTFPSRTVPYFVFGNLFCNCWISSPAILLLTPIILVGLTALSVEINTKEKALSIPEASATTDVPVTLFLWPLWGLAPSWGHACRQLYEILPDANTLSLSRTSPIIGIVSRLGNSSLRFSSS